MNADTELRAVQETGRQSTRLSRRDGGIAAQINDDIGQVFGVPDFAGNVLFKNFSKLSAAQSKRFARLHAVTGRGVALSERL